MREPNNRRSIEINFQGNGLIFAIDSAFLTPSSLLHTPKQFPSRRKEDSKAGTKHLQTTSTQIPVPAIPVLSSSSCSASMPLYLLIHPNTSLCHTNEFSGFSTHYRH
jgi:hypothetical protein